MKPHTFNDTPRAAWVIAAALLVSAACSDPIDPCSNLDGPAIGMPAFDVVGALRTAGAEVEDLGERLETTLMSTAPRELRVDGHTVLWYEYCAPSVASNDARRFSSDASTFDGVPMTWTATPHIYVMAQVLLIYKGDDPDLLALLELVIGAPYAEGTG